MNNSARQLLSRANKILADVDESYIISHRGHKQRLMPVFRPEEISLGRTLGTGGFGIVQEILMFTLDPEEGTDGEHDHAREEKSEHHQLINGTASCTNGTTITASDNHPEDNNNSSSSAAVSTVVVPTTHDEHNMSDNNDHVHYDVLKARHWMEKQCQRKGVSRYALKRLHENLNEIERARGMVDLAVEAKYLSVVWHPNIGTCSRT